MTKFPKDCSSRKIGSRARQLVHWQFNVDRWEYHEITGTDHGTDCTLELIENNEFLSHEIKGQIKGSKKIEYKENNKFISFALDVKTIHYGLNSSVPFLLFLVDVEREIVYYLPLQEYFIDNSILFERLSNNKATLTVHIPCDKIVDDDDVELQQLAHYSYVGGATMKLHRAL